MSETQNSGVHRRMLEAIVCPLTHATLEYCKDDQELISQKAGLAYRISKARLLTNYTARMIRS